MSSDKPKKKSNWQGRVYSPEYNRNRPLAKQRDNNICVRCYLMFGHIVEAAHCDHYIPLSKGGTDKLTNLWMLCEDCHKEKTQRESNGKSGFRTVILLNGDDAEELDWQTEIWERTNNMLLNMSSV